MFYPVLLALLPLIFFWWSYSMAQGKVCPDCGTPLRPFQSPFTKTRRQWLKGGYLCTTCGCEMDISGRKVAVGSPPLPRSILYGFGAVIFGTVLALPVLMFFLLRR